MIDATSPEAAKRVTMGPHCYGPLTISCAVGTDEKDHVTIGDFCAFAPGVRVLLGGEHHTDWVTAFPLRSFPAWFDAEQMKNMAFSRGGIEVGNDVWIGMEALILAGAKIGDGAIIAPRSVVSGAVAPYSVFAGNPARLARWRFSEAVRSDLLNIRWWTWDDERIKRAAPFLLSPNIERFIEMYHAGDL